MVVMHIVCCCWIWDWFWYYSSIYRHATYHKVRQFQSTIIAIVTYVYYRRIDSVTEGDEIYGILSGVSSSAFSLGWATVFINDYNTICSEFIGPIIGGGLAKVMSFQMSAAVSDYMNT